MFNRFYKIAAFLLFWVIIVFGLLMMNRSEVREEAREKTAGHTGHIHGSGTLPEHQNLNQQPVPLEIERDGKDVYIKITAQITDIELQDGYIYKAWAFNGQAPGPLVVVNEGDTIHFTLENRDPSMAHSMDFHAVHSSG